MSDANLNIPEDRPEYTSGDVVEVFSPINRSYQWIEVEEVLQVHASQALLSEGAFYCACWVRVESLALPRTCARKGE